MNFFLKHSEEKAFRMKEMGKYADYKIIFTFFICLHCCGVEEMFFFV